MDLKQFNRALVGISKKFEDAKPILHGLAMFALEQGLRHGNIVPMQDLLGKLPKNCNILGLQRWAVTFGPFEISNGVVKHGRKARMQEAEKFLEQASQLMFWEFTPETEVGEVAPYNGQSALISAIAKIKRDIISGKAAPEAMVLLDSVVAALPGEVAAKVALKVEDAKARV